jgi:4-amino-4-deoxy-L-arabinose transferase-like glycosyltransferase
MFLPALTFGQETFLPVLIAQDLVGAGSVLCAALIARELFGSTAAVIAAVLAAIYPNTWCNVCTYKHGALIDSM